MPVGRNQIFGNRLEIWASWQLYKDIAIYPNARTAGGKCSGPQAQDFELGATGRFSQVLLEFPFEDHAY